MRAGLVLACLLIGFSGQPVLAQETPALSSPILTLDDERMFTGSAFGKAVLARQEANAQTLTEENRRIETALEVEEKDLTARRAPMSRADFLPLSDAFNQKVEGIRKAQDAKSRDLNRAFEEDRQRFLQAARPILAQVMQDAGAIAIIDSRAVFVGFDNIDITDAAIARLDAAFADGSLALTAP
ncbi:MAG: OmpH family outer membrane protein [Pseudorhodobacter sp.]|nr:MAG: OmpH family outer membrane protein [Pseudorhodobacter sp.]